MAALRESDKVRETARGPVRFDKYGNVVGNIYIRRVEKKGGKLRQHRDQDLSRTSASSGPTTPTNSPKHPVYNRETWPDGTNVEP